MSEFEVIAVVAIPMVIVAVMITALRIVIQKAAVLATNES